MILETRDGKKVYSDGNETEMEMLRIAEEYPEDLSEDFIANSSKYTINNTFSSVRKNILNWYSFNKDSDVLEIGAGMGSLTGMLCDKCRNVTALEMNPVRAEVIRQRYRTRKNLTILAQDVNTWNTDEKFDYIIMIGVLEYAAVFTHTNNPFEDFLRKVKTLLKEDGKVLIAIENRFGLKYLCGASEDHLQKPYVGINGYKEPKTPTTFSKYELQQMLSNVGLAKNRFYYALPDYRFPQLIYTDEYLPKFEELQKVPFTYSKGSQLTSNEKELYKDVIENGVFGLVANSYLIEATAGQLPEDKIIHVSARGECKKKYRITTKIDNHKNVIKEPCHIEAIDHVKNIYLTNELFLNRGIKVLPATYKEDKLVLKYFEGKKADKEFIKYLRTNDLKSLCAMIDNLRSNIIKSSEIVQDGKNIIDENNLSEKAYDYGMILECGYIDMTFYNAFYEEGDLIFFDQEWKFDNVPLNFILYYAIKCVYNRAQVKSSISFDVLLDYIGIKDEYKIYDKLEEFIWSTVLYRQGDFYGEDGYCNQYNENLTLKYTQEIKDREIQNRRQNEIELSATIEKMIGELNNKKLHIDQLMKSENNLKEQVKQYIQIESSLKEQVKQCIQLESSLKEQINQYAQTEKNLRGHVDQLIQSERNLNGHVELLLQSDRELKNIKKTLRWKLANIPWIIMSILLPRNSRRRTMARLAMNGIKHPVLYLKKFNLGNIKEFIDLFSHNNVGEINQKITNLIELNTDVVAQRIEIIDVEKENFEILIMPAYSNPKVSIIIPVYNEFKYTYNCIKSILLHTTDVEYEVIVADDVSSDTTKQIKEIIKNITICRNEKNLGFLLNCNNAAQYAKGKYIHFLNNDTQVQEEWLSSLIKLIESDDKIGMVGSKLVYPDGRLQEAGGIIWNDASGWNYGRLDDPTKPDYNYVREVDYISGASIMLSKELWNEIGGFDKRYIPAYYEDTDLAFEVRRHGYKVMYQPKSVVVHFEGVSNGTDINSGIKKYQQDNREKFLGKWEQEFKEQFPSGECVLKARGRGKNKKSILIIDHYVPHFDKDAGSKCTFNYITLFKNMGLDVTFIGDNFYPHEPYTEILQQMGINVLYGNWYHDNYEKWLRENGQYFDYVYMNRPHISIKYIDILKKYTEAKIIYFGHDLHYLRELRNYEIEKDEKLLKASEEWKIVEFELFNKADVVYVVGEYEQKVLQEQLPDKPIRNIPVYIYEKSQEPIQIGFNERKDLLFVGGFNHKPNVDGILWFYHEILPLIKEQVPDIKLYIVGSNPTQDILALNSADVIVTGFVSDEELTNLYNSCRVVVAPLRFGAGVKGKVVEAIYNQVPLVTTSIGAEGLSEIEDYIDISDDALNFAEKVVEIYRDEKTWNKMSIKSIEYIDTYFSQERAYNIVKQDVR